MNNSEMVREISEQTGFSMKDVTTVLEAQVGVISSALKDGDPVVVKGIGAFSVKSMAARNGRNPATGDPMVVPAKDVVKVKLTKSLKELCQ